MIRADLSLLRRVGNLVRIDRNEEGGGGEEEVEWATRQSITSEDVDQLHLGSSGKKVQATLATLHESHHLVVIGIPRNFVVAARAMSSYPGHTL